MYVTTFCYVANITGLLGLDLLNLKNLENKRVKLFRTTF